MIEDDLRAAIGQAVSGVDVYARQIPLDLPQCITVQLLGGRPSTSSIRRATHIVNVMAVSEDREMSDYLVRQGRDALIQAIPFDSADAHYYTARAVTEGCITEVRPSSGGVVYVSFVDMEVVVSL